jgi:hypothetical protein
MGHQCYLRTDTLEAATAYVLSTGWPSRSRPTGGSWRAPHLMRSASPYRSRPRRPGVAAPYLGLRQRWLSVYTWTVDRWGPFATRVISASVREATVVLDDILDNAFELRPEQHSTDTAGWTDIVFALGAETAWRASPPRSTRAGWRPASSWPS